MFMTLCVDTFLLCDNSSQLQLHNYKRNYFGPLLFPPPLIRAKTPVLQMKLSDVDRARKPVKIY